MKTNGKTPDPTRRDPVRPPQEIGDNVEDLGAYICSINYLAEAGLEICHEGPGGEQKLMECMIGILAGISTMAARACDLANAYGPELYGLPVHQAGACECTYCYERARRGKEPYRWSVGEPVAPMRAAAAK